MHKTISVIHSFNMLQDLVLRSPAAMLHNERPDPDFGLATTAIALEFSFPAKLAKAAEAAFRALAAICPTPGEQCVLTPIFTAAISQKSPDKNTFL